MGTGTDVWWEELYRVVARKPHPPVACVSIASSSPLALWQCPSCYRTLLALRDYPPDCVGGYAWRDAVEGNGSGHVFGTRAETLSSLVVLRRYSRETAGADAYAYHREWISTHTQV